MIMTADEEIGGVVYEIRVWQTETGGFSPGVFVIGDALTDWQDQFIDIGGEDDPDTETPEEAIELARRLLREQAERGNLNA